jgi:hypothetical protein
MSLLNVKSNAAVAMPTLYIVLTLCVFANAISTGSRVRASNDAKRFETFDRFDRTMVESRPSISRVGYGGIPVSSNELSNLARQAVLGGNGGIVPAAQPEPSPGNLVSGLLVTRLASDMARLSQHALRSKETRIPVYVAVAESDEEGIPTSKALPRLIHLMDASSSKARDPTIVPAVLGSDEEVEEQLPEYMEKNRQYTELGIGDKPAGKPILFGSEEENKSSAEKPTGYTDLDRPREYDSGARTNIFQTPTLPESGRGPQQDNSGASTQSMSRLPVNSVSKEVDMMEKIQALLERQQEQLFRQHIENMVKEQLQQLVKQQISLIAKEQLAPDSKNPESVAAASSTSNTQRPSNSPSAPSSSSYDHRKSLEAQAAKTLLDKMNGASAGGSQDSPLRSIEPNAMNAELDRHMEVLTSLVKQHMDALAKPTSPVAHSSLVGGVVNAAESRPEGQVVAKDDGSDRADHQLPLWVNPAVTQRRIFYDDEHGDIRRMVMPFDEHQESQRTFLKNFRHQLLHARRPRDVQHLEPRREDYVHSGTVPLLVMPPGQGETQPRLAILAPMPFNNQDNQDNQEEDQK